MKKICFVSSCGGHLTEILNYCQDLKDYDFFFVINEKRNINFLKKKYYFISHSTFDLKIFVVLLQSLKILLKEKPDVIISTGASPALPFFIWAKILSIKTIFLESITRVHALSKTGKIIKYLTKNFYVQNKLLSRTGNFKFIDPQI